MNAPDAKKAPVVRLLAEAFDPGAELNRFTAQVRSTGAVASFTGIVRSTPEHPVTTLTLEHYPQLAQNQLEDLASAAQSRFKLEQCEILHRFGTLKVNEPIVLVLAASAHRQAAIDAVSFMMDTLKTSAPFWKKEQSPTQSTWVNARESDDIATQKWHASEAQPRLKS